MVVTAEDLAASRSTGERVRAAAVQLFASRGFHATGIRAIADESGLSLSSLYNYMGGKEDLLAEIMVTNIESAMTAAERALKGLASPPERLAALARALVFVQLEHPLEAIVSDNELRSLGMDTRERVLKQRDLFDDLWRSALDDGIKQGMFSVTQPSVTRAVLIEACNCVVRWYSPHGSLGRAQVADQLVELCLRMTNATIDRRPMTLDDVSTPSAKDVAQIVSEIFAQRR